MGRSWRLQVLTFHALLRHLSPSMMLFLYFSFSLFYNRFSEIHHPHLHATTPSNDFSHVMAPCMLFWVYRILLRLHNAAVTALLLDGSTFIAKPDTCPVIDSIALVKPLISKCLCSASLRLPCLIAPRYSSHNGTTVQSGNECTAFRSCSIIFFPSCVYPSHTARFMSTTHRILDKCSY